MMIYNDGKADSMKIADNGDMNNEALPEREEEQEKEKKINQKKKKNKNNE